jgi:hypothetical protein
MAKWELKARGSPSHFHVCIIAHIPRPTDMYPSPHSQLTITDFPRTPSLAFPVAFDQAFESG